MTVDIIVVTNTDQMRFTDKVLEEVQLAEANGYTVEVKFSTVEKDNHWGDKIQYSALLHVYSE